MSSGAVSFVQKLEAFRAGCKDGLRDVLSDPLKLEAFEEGWEDGLREILVGRLNHLGFSFGDRYQQFSDDYAEFKQWRDIGWTEEARAAALEARRAHVQGPVLGDKPLPAQSLIITVGGPGQRVEVPNIEVLVNPRPRDVSSMGHDAQDNALRSVVDRHGNLFVWKAEDAIHGHVAESLHRSGVRFGGKGGTVITGGDTWYVGRRIAEVFKQQLQAGRKAATRSTHDAGNPFTHWIKGEHGLFAGSTPSSTAAPTPAPAPPTPAVVPAPSRPPSRMSSRRAQRAQAEENWSLLSSADQDRVFDRWQNSTYDEFYNSEVENWRDSGEPVYLAKGQLVEDFNSAVFGQTNDIWESGDWAEQVVYDWMEERGDVPYKIEQIAASLSVDYRNDEVSFKFDDNKLKEPTTLTYDPEKQLALPAIEPANPAQALTPEMRKELSAKLETAFIKRAERLADDVEPPDHLSESVGESQNDYWGQMDDSEKWSYAEQYGYTTPGEEPPPEEEPPEEPSIPKVTVSEMMAKHGIDAAALKEAVTAGYVNSRVSSNNYGKVNVDLRDDRNKNIGRYAFTVNPSDKTASMDYMDIVSDKQRGGVAKKLATGTMKIFEKIGIRELSVTAGLSIGGYAWAKYGFTPDQDDWEGLQASMRQRIEDAKRPDVDWTLRNLRYSGANVTEKELHEYAQILKSPSASVMQLIGSRDPRAVWAISDTPYGKPLLLATSWHGKLSFDDPLAMRRARAYVFKSAVRGVTRGIGRTVRRELTRAATEFKTRTKELSPS